jgi:polyisoprenoid-binding protein YceI
MKSWKPCLLAAAISLAAAVAALSFPSARAAGATYKVDTVHSTLIFKIKHMGAANFYGRFNTISGTFTLDGGPFEFEVKADSVDTGNQKRDEHLKGPDFFNVRQFPAIAFKGKDVKKAGDKSYEIAGDLTLHGVTKPIQVKSEQTGTGKNQQGKNIIGIESTFTIKRSDFGMNYGQGALGDDVHVIVSTECAES